MQVGNQNQMKVLLPQIRNQPGKIGEGLRINSEGPISVLIINIKVENIGRNLVGTETIGDFANLRFRSVAVTRLLETKTPKRRKRMSSGEVGVALHNLLRVGAIDQVII